MSNYCFTTTDTNFNITFEEKHNFGRQSTKVHQLLLTFVCRSKCLAESFQRGGSLCRVRCSFGYSEVEAQLRVEVVLRAGAHDVSVWAVLVSHKYEDETVEVHHSKQARV